MIRHPGVLTKLYQCLKSSHVPSVYHIPLVYVRQCSSVATAFDFHKVADKSLDELYDVMSHLEIVDKTADDIEISLSQGVLKLESSNHGSWVINKQAPNKQLWWSSPISGPRRYEYIANGNSLKDTDLDIFTTISNQGRLLESHKWRSTRDGSTLLRVLRDEVLNKTGVDISKQ